MASTKHNELYEFRSRIHSAGQEDPLNYVYELVMLLHLVKVTWQVSVFTSALEAFLGWNFY